MSSTKNNLPADVRKNIIRLYIIKASKWFMLIMPIVVPFYEENGLSLHQIMVLKAIYSVSIVIFEIPSGYFADILGRKNTLISGAFLGTAGFVIYSFTGSFTGFIIAELILGAGQSMISGADSAILYDTLNERKLSKEYVKYEGRTISIGNFAESIAGLLGGLLAIVSLRYPYYAQSVVAFFAIPASLTLYEPARIIKDSKPAFGHIFKIVRYALIDNKKLRSNILYSSVIGTCTLTMAWFVQPVFGSAGINISYYGLLWTGLNVLVGLTALKAYSVEQALGKKTTLFLISLLMPLGFVFAGLTNQSVYSLIIIALFYLIRGVATPVLKDYINRDTDSDKRATVLSLRSFILRMMFAALAPLMGWVSDNFSLSYALSGAGVIFLLATIPLYLNYLRKLSRNNH